MKICGLFRFYSSVLDISPLSLPYVQYRRNYAPPLKNRLSQCPKMSPVVCTKNAIFRVCKPTLQRFPPRLACLQLHHRYSPLSRTPVCLYDVHSLVCTTYTEVSRLDLSLHLPKLALQKAEALLLSCEGTSWSCWSIVVATAYV